jgi:hypothetical protein
MGPVIADVVWRAHDDERAVNSRLRWRPLAAFAGPGLDEGPFEFGEASEDRQHQHPMRGRGVAPSILERA